jgi:hypothetical protein
MIHYWEQFLEEGNDLYEYMTNNFDTMFDGESIKHFEIREGQLTYIYNLKNLSEEHGEYIQKELIPWIKNEHNENRLFDKTLWKPFRDQYHLHEMYYGYRRLFQYRHYYFQLIMETECILDICKYCILSGATNSIHRITEEHFSVTLYSWKEDGSNMFQPSNNLSIPSDNMMPEFDWIRQ